MKKLGMKFTRTSLMVVLLSLLLASSFVACKKNKNKITPVCDGTNATYNSTVKAIVNASCVSCHSSYSTYSGLSVITSNGKFEKHVLTKQDMPEGTTLTADQLNKIQCWLEAGFPEN